MGKYRVPLVLYTFNSIEWILGYSVRHLLLTPEAFNSIEWIQEVKLWNLDDVIYLSIPLNGF